MAKKQRQRLIDREPDRVERLLLAALPFIILIFAYTTASEIRLAENPNDKLLPSFTTMAEAVDRMAFQPDRRTGKYLLWSDTLASLQRLALGMLMATLFATVLGVMIGLIPYANRTFSPFVAVLAMVPPLAILPILFILFGLGELSKVALIVIGVAPFLTRDLALRVGEIPHEQIIKAQTLGASTWQITNRVVLPQMWPRLIDSVRLTLGSAWLFLIAAEAIASEGGLGYRIFLVRRYLAMDVILPYVAWITFLAFAFDYFLRLVQSIAFPWFASERRMQ